MEVGYQARIQVFGLEGAKFGEGSGLGRSPGGGPGGGQSPPEAEEAPAI